MSHFYYIRSVFIKNRDSQSIETVCKIAYHEFDDMFNCYSHKIEISGGLGPTAGKVIYRGKSFNN